MDKLFDINEVCKILCTTSRTLRFYEEKGIIQSITTPFSPRRKYTEEQIEHIKNVLILRALKIPIKDIIELQNNNADLKSTIISKRAEALAQIDAKLNEINILGEAVALIDAGESIFEKDFSLLSDERFEKCSAIVSECTKAIISGDTKVLYKHFCDKLIEYMPPEAYERVRSDTLAPLGGYIKTERITHSEQPNILYSYVKYENLGLKIKYVLYKDKIHGLWLGYYES